MRIQAIVFDLDDTLLRDDRTISRHTCDVLKQKASEGLRILPASGRIPASMMPYMQSLGCVKEYIASNGAEICDCVTGQVLYRCEFTLDESREIADFGNEFHVYQQTYENDRFMYSHDCEYATIYAETSGLRGVCVGDLKAYLRENVSKILMIDEPEKIAMMHRKANERFGDRFQITRSKPNYLEFDPPEGNKGKALERLCARLDIPVSEVMAFGDSLNDLPMLLTAGIGVAVGNARPEVKEACGHVCGTNQEDGVAGYILQHLSGKEYIG